MLKPEQVPDEVVEAAVAMRDRGGSMRDIIRTALNAWPGTGHCHRDEQIARLRAEVERLNKSRNKWGQKYNKLLEEHKVTVSQLKAAVWSDSEECKLLTAENESLRAALEKICNGPRDADLDYLDLFVEVKMEARAALSGDKHE